MAAGVLAATLSLSALTHAQGSVKRPTENQSVSQNDGSDSVAAQPSLLSVSGTVVDPTGAVVERAKVILRAPASYRETTTNDSGQFTFSGVEPGAYEPEVSAPGFVRMIVQGLTLRENFKFEKNLVLEAGDALMGVIAIAEGPLVCDEPAAISDKIVKQELLTLPSGRTFTTMGLTPGLAEKPKADKKKPAKKNKNKLPN